MLFIYVIFKNEMIKSDNNLKNSMTDKKLIKLYNKLPYEKSIFDIMIDSADYFFTQYPVDFMQYLIDNNGKLKNDINKITSILESIINIKFS